MNVIASIASAFVAVSATLGVPDAAASQPLRFSAPEGAVLNEFYRQGPVAAHVVLTPGRTPRLVVAFPAGNSGAAVWFDARSGALSWRPDVKVDAAYRTLADGSELRGVTVDVAATGGAIAVRQAITSSVRVIRNYEDSGEAPPEILAEPRLSEREVVWARRRLDGAPGYYLSIEVLGGTVGRARPIELSPDANGELRLRVTALTGDAPLTPLDEKDVLTDAAAPDVRLRRALAFLCYEEKLLAGSWRFNTYFGRDTLMSLRLLAPVLQPRVMEAGLASVLARLNAAGEVAHEEDVGEFALLRRMQAGSPRNDAPLFDYKMIDDDFMLPVVAAHYLLDTPGGRPRAAAFLARAAGSDGKQGARLVSNLRYIVAAAAPFAREPDWRHLIALKPGERVGNWRDSEVGLGGGRYPYDVNGVFAPAALAAIGRLHASGLLKPYLDSDVDRMLSRAASMATVWLRAAPPLFEVAVPSESARGAVQKYALRTGVDATAALRSVGGETVRFRALALDAQGRPIPIVNSDEAFALLFLNPAPAEAERLAGMLTRPFPAGLMTDVGLLVANPAYAPDELESRFDRNRYHGAVIWSWQQAMFAAGLARQLKRDDLTAPARAALMRARDRLRAAIEAADAVRGSELWSWSVANGRYRVEPFGQREEDETESNAAQLWSTVHLARPRE
ncbi:MAG: hypothetical protein ACREV5_01540 [Steroidobacter sp.]